METILRFEEVDSFFAGYRIVTNKQVIELLIGNQDHWCESWGYFWCNEKPDDFIGASVTGIEIVDAELNKKIYDSEVECVLDQGGVMFVNILTDKGILQFVAYNCHNGYYGHEATVKSTQLEHSECL